MCYVKRSFISEEENMAFDMSELPQLARDFASHKLNIQGCSPKTVSEYCFDLRTFFRYLIADRNGIPFDSEDFEKIDCTVIDIDFIKTIETSDVYEFIMYVSGSRHNSAAAKARKLSAIKGFFKFLIVNRHLIEVNPAANIETPRKKKSLPKHLSLEESIDLLNTVKLDPESRTKERDYCMITLFLNTGMRLSELAGISFSDLDRELRSLRVTGKGNKERIIYLNDACRAALTDYLPVRMAQPVKKVGESALFLSLQGQRINISTIQKLVTKYLNAAGLEYKHFSTHKLRHTAATLMYQSGQVDVRVLKEILGHEQLNTTQIYTHVSDEGMENAVMANPLAEFGVSNEKDRSEKPRTKRTVKRDL